MLSKQRYNLKTPPICYTPDGIAQPPFSIDDIKLGWRISNDGYEDIWYYNGTEKNTLTSMLVLRIHGIQNRIF